MHAHVHHSMGPTQQAQQAAMRKILRPDEVQAKPDIGENDGKYKQEADRVADAVMRMPEPQLQRQPVEEDEEEEEVVQTELLSDEITPLIQRQEETDIEEGEEELVQTKTITEQSTPLIQRQGENEEEEEVIQSKFETNSFFPLQFQVEDKKKEEYVQTRSFAEKNTPLIQRQKEKEEEEEETIQTLTVQRHEEEEEVVQSSSGEAVSLTNNTSKTAEAIRTRGSGAPMHPTIKRTLESRMGVDLSEVRVHDDSSAHQASANLKAKAFTHKNHIWLGPGESQTDLRLMSHETTHVLQQGGIVRRKPLDTEEDEELVQTLPNSEAEQATTSHESRSPSRSPNSPSSGGRSAVPAERTTQAAAPTMAERVQVPQARAEAREGRAALPDAAVPETVPPAPAGVAPEDQERHQVVIERLEEAATQQEGAAASSDSQRQASEQAAEEASAAAPSPANEAQARGQEAQVETMNAQEAGEVNQESFLEIVRRRLREITPSTPSDLDEFRERGGASGLREGLLQTANQQAEGAQRAIRSATETEPTPGEARVPEALPEQAGPGQVPDLRAQEVLPQARDEAEVSLEEKRQDVESRLGEENLTEDRLRRANDPRFTAVQETREAVHEHADTAPREYREEEQALLNEQEGAIASEETTATREMEQSRERSQREIEAEQQTAMTVEERRRQEVSDHIEGIYTRTRQDVEERLEDLNREVESRFTEGERRARERFEEFVDREMNIWKFRRYMVSGTGAFTRIADLFRDINDLPEVKQIYEDGKNQYIAELDTVIVDIANLVETTLAWCRDEIQQGLDDIQEYVEEGLPEALREVGEQTSGRISERFDELRASVEERRNTLADQLVERYQQARQALDQRIEAMQAENRGLVNRFVEGLQAVLEVLRNLRERLASILGEGSGAIECVLNDPPGFVGNLIGAVGRGFRQFAGNILAHLRRGLMGWLFGTLASAGIEIPSEFSLRAIIGLILQILGITRDRLRTKVVRIVGERNVAVVERVWGVVSTLVREGPQGLWDEIRQGVGNLKEMVIEGIKQWVIIRIVMAAVNRIVTMWNPAGAIVQAVLAIYNTLMFFWERRDQILDLVQSIVRSVDSICRGSLAQAANLVERTMGLTLPVIISFFARFLGLGGIAAAIQGIIRRPQRRVDRAIDRALRRIARRLGLRGRGRRRRGVDVRRYRQLADRAAAELSRVTGPPQSPDVLRRQKRQQARQLQRTYSSRLGRGARMRIQIARARRGQEERGIGFTIAVRPGSVRKRGTIAVRGESAPERERRNGDQLDRAVREIRPQLRSLLRRGTRTETLRARLDTWRVRYRIRRLSLERRGSEYDVTASNSRPERKLARVFEGDEEEILKITRQELRQRSTTEQLEQVQIRLLTEEWERIINRPPTPNVVRSITSCVKRFGKEPTIMDCIERSSRRELNEARTTGVVTHASRAEMDRAQIKAREMGKKIEALDESVSREISEEPEAADAENREEWEQRIRQRATELLQEIIEGL